MWFGEDASLRRLPDPLREKSSRPLMLADDELDPHLKTSWTKVQSSNSVVIQVLLKDIGRERGRRDVGECMRDEGDVGECMRDVVW